MTEAAGVCYNPHLRFSPFMVRFFVSPRVFVATAALTVACAASVFAQADQPRPTAPSPSPTPPIKTRQKPTTAEQVAELTIFFYGGGGARERLNQIRKTTFERGTYVYTRPDGKTETAKYQRFVIRADSLDKEKIRLDQEFPSATYSLVRSDDRVYGIYNNTVFAPREDAVRSFEDQVIHGIEALLRYKENGSTITQEPNEKLYGVDYYVLTVTDKQDRKTRFYISQKTFRVMMLTYEEAGTKYRRKFYDYNYAQGTLVPFRTVLWADEKQIEESEIGTITFGQRVAEDLFRTS